MELENDKISFPEDICEGNIYSGFETTRKNTDGDIFKHSLRHHSDSS